MPIILILLFFATAVLYASVGFGGGSTYTALLVLSGVDYRIIPLVSLACNILVVSGNTLRYAQAGEVDLKRLAPALALSIPCAWLGGRVQLDQLVFITLLGAVLLVSGILLFTGTSQRQTGQTSGSGSPLPLMAAGAICGGLAGLVGIGGGIFLAPVLYWMKWSTERRIAAACSVFILLNSLAGLTGQLNKAGTFDLVSETAPYLLLLPAVMLGGWIGNRISLRHLKGSHLRKGTALLILFVALRLLYQAGREMWF